MIWERVVTHPEVQLRVDPYYEWARSTGFAHFFREGQEQRFPVLIELNGISAEDFESGNWHAPAGWRDMIDVPAMYGRAPRGLASFPFCSATVTQAFFSQVGTNAALRQVIRRVELSLPVDNYGADRMFRLGAVVDAPGVVTGIIDDAIAFAHERFRLPDNRTRIQYFWNQDATAVGPSVPYGRELRKNGIQGIDINMAAATHAGMVDEDRVYAATGHFDSSAPGHKPGAWRIGHGTHVLDLAAGHDHAVAPGNRPIIGVQLPVRATADTSGSQFGRYALDGLYYILRRADRLRGSPPPVVINCSYGFIAGPHDGSSIVEAAIDRAIQLRPAPLAVVLPAGNSHLSRCHARLPLAPGASRTIRWRLQPDDYTPSYVEMWLPDLGAAGPAQVRLRIRPPGGAWSPWVNEGESWRLDIGGQTVAEAIYHDTIAPGRNRNMILLAAAPTATLQPNREVAPSQVWQIQVENVGPRAAIDAWIQRDDTPYGYPTRGRQSYFDDPDYVRFRESGEEEDADNNSYVQRRRTLNSLATGRRTIVIGGFHRKDWRASKYSASGPPIRPARGGLAPNGPDAMCVADDSNVHHGILAAGARSGSCVAMFGTSVAAPQIARWVADRMEAGLPFDRDAVFNFARVGAAPGYRTEANPPPGARPQPPVRRSGGGRIEPPSRRPPRFER